MLNRKTLPVWMLADALMVVGIGGGLIVLLIASPFLKRSDRTFELAAIRQELMTVTEQKRQIESENLNLEAQQKSVQERLSNLQRYQDEAVVWIDVAQKELAYLRSRVGQEKDLRKDLLNLRGDLARTLFVIDVSGSMGISAETKLDRPNWGADGKPWTYVRNQVDTWLTHLPVESFRVLCFNHEIVEFPSADQQWVSGDIWRNKAREFLSGCEPDGFTYTESALVRAFEWKPTTIILFTDGAPSDAEGKLDMAQQERVILLLSERAAAIPINVIAVNNYFDANLGGFLHSIAARTGGGFVGL